MTIATVVCLLALVALLVATARGRKAAVWVSKPLASAAFVAVAIAAGAPAGGPYAAWMLAGLLLAAGGDVALMLESKRAFLVGLVLFLLGHLAYAGACASVLPPGRWGGALALVPVIGGVGALAWLWPRLGSMRGPVVAYVVVIGAMLAGAFAVRAAGALPPARADRLALGALLFWLSDLSVARDRFVARSFVNRAWGLPAYYVGQLLLAWSLT
jgi:uncharacterized membrane protein YhhN